MNTFRFSHEPLDPAALAQALHDPACGGYASFEGWVRNHNEGLEVNRLENEAISYAPPQQHTHLLLGEIQRAFLKLSEDHREVLMLIAVE